jgi:hypothetical protein
LKDIANFGCRSAKIYSSGFPAYFQILLILFNSLLKMNSATSILDPELELMNVRSLNFVKPKLFFKAISCYAATSTMLHIRISFNFRQVFKTKGNIANTYL